MRQGLSEERSCRPSRETIKSETTDRERCDETCLVLEFSFLALPPSRSPEEPAASNCTKLRRHRGPDDPKRYHQLRRSHAPLPKARNETADLNSIVLLVTHIPAVNARRVWRVSCAHLPDEVGRLHQRQKAEGEGPHGLGRRDALYPALPRGPVLPEGGPGLRWRGIGPLLVLLWRRRRKSLYRGTNFRFFVLRRVFTFERFREKRTQETMSGIMNRKDSVTPGRPPEVQGF